VGKLHIALSGGPEREGLFSGAWLLFLGGIGEGVNFRISPMEPNGIANDHQEKRINLLEYTAENDDFTNYKACINYTNPRTAVF
jgi:hypothetical protein